MVAAMTLYLSTLIVVWNVVVDVVTQPPGSADGGKRLAVRLLKVLDILLIALTFQIISISLYRLFIKSSSGRPSQFIKVLRINNFHDLKITLLHVTIVILAILFLEQAVEVGAALETLYFGASVAVVIVAIVFATKHMAD
ncbi:MAG: YqhA family protein [Idiomarina sp.]|nr:YqhA family protein [Idiomarina sp.]